MANWDTTLKVERLNDGMPLIAADPKGWDDGFTLNPTAVRLERSPRNDEIIANMLGMHPNGSSRLTNGVVAVLYRGIPKHTSGPAALRSSAGLAVFTPEMKLIKRFAYPVVMPTDDPMGCDYDGVEDQRVTRIGDTFYMVYCGYNTNLPMEHNIHVCMATSEDLVNWTKLGPVPGSVNDVPNKDAVILPEPVNGCHVMLHRPCVGVQGNLGISIAISNSPTGRWTDLGMIMRPYRDSKYSCSWLGAGSAPLALGANRFLMDYHTGNRRATGERDYIAGYAVLNFNGFDVSDPSTLLESRYEGVLTPQTLYELNSPWPHEKTLNCVFPCGSYEHGGDVYLVYGGADAYVLAARTPKTDLLARLASANCHPSVYDKRLHLAALRPQARLVPAWSRA